MRRLALGGLDAFGVDPRAPTEPRMIQEKVESASTTSHDTAYERAFSLIASPATKKAFDLGEEKDTVRDRYGRNTFGQSCLLARRLIERGVRFVTINMFETVFNEITWDIHGSAPFSPIECYKDEGAARGAGRARQAASGHRHQRCFQLLRVTVRSHTGSR